jgi:hypothetical protein
MRCLRVSRLRQNTKCCALFYAVHALIAASSALAADPLASNNGLYPTAPGISMVVEKANEVWTGPFRLSNYDYPRQAESGWLKVKPKGPLTLANAEDYLNRMKTYLASDMKQMIENPDAWSKSVHAWYSVPWTAQAAETNGKVDPTSGREAILGSTSGQVIRRNTFATAGLTANIQNHTVIYYDPVAALTLRKIWHQPLNPQVGNHESEFNEGAIVLKAGGVTATPEQWPVVTGSTVWHVYRPSFKEGPGGGGPTPPPIVFDPDPVVTPLRVLQFDMIVKDKEASPKTGFVFLAWVYDCKEPAQPDCGMPGSTTWDRLVPLGAMWGSDPAFATNPHGTNPDPNGPPLLETWINPGAPAYAKSTLGWGGRLSGPIDVSERHGVLLTTGGPLQQGVHVSSCLACHIASQYPFIGNLYPSPNLQFPQEGQPFLLYPPGSPEFARWFQDLPGEVAFSAANDSDAVGLSYDFVETFALASFNNAAGNRLRALARLPLH